MRMASVRVGGFGAFMAALALASSLVVSVSTDAEARGRHGFKRSGLHAHHARYVAKRHFSKRSIRHATRSRATVGSRAGFLAPAFASIVVDANTGKTLEATNETSPRHPASVTKVMTLYLLFEQLEKGKLKLDSEIPISSHAAAQSPSKLGLRPGSTIEVEDAIKAVVTKSANDIAVAIAEAVGGDEETFAEQMTRRARSLGMNGTTYRNASGLPNPQQITTARDLAILGRAIQDRFPRYYRYFATRTFQFGSRTMPNHNHLLGRVEGMDGIKTGYTAASGFNLLTSVKRDGRYVVGVVLGGRSGGQRDRIMANLIEDHLADASTRRTAVAVTEQDASDVRPSARIMESAPDTVEVVRKPPARIEARVPLLAPADTKPEPRRTETASLDLAVPAAPVGKLANRIDDKPRPAFVTAARPEADTAETGTKGGTRRVANDGSTGRAMAYASTTTATPSGLRWVEGPAGRAAARTEETKTAKGHSEIAKTVAEAKPAADKIALVRPSQTGWMIQIGATEDAEKAHDLIARAKSKAALGMARPFTEKVQKGGETLWRARFAGLEETSAEAACRTLKRSGFSCFATRN